MAKRVWTRGALAGLAGLGVLMMTVRQSPAQGTIASDRPAGYVVFPKIVVDTAGVFSGGAAQDTTVQLTNTSASALTVHCFYVNATGHCNNTPLPTACQLNVQCPAGGICEPGWAGDNFTITLSPNQPTGWRASLGTTPTGSVPPVKEDPFIGELKCIEVNDSTAQAPLNSNDLKGEATIETVTGGPAGAVDARAYNAIGIQTVLNDKTVQADPGTTGGQHTMCLGSNTASTECSTAEYAACPSVLILNHFFDFAIVGNANGASTVLSDLTLVPCSENFVTPSAQTTTTAQFLVFNEFEQRFSASTAVNCFKEIRLSDIDTPGAPFVSGALSSIWSAFVQGTLVGQTRIRAVTGTETTTGHGLLGIGEQFNMAATHTGSAAFNLNYVGTTANQADFVRFVPQP